MKSLESMAEETKMTKSKHAPIFGKNTLCTAHEQKVRPDEDLLVERKPHEHLTGFRQRDKVTIWSMTFHNSIYIGSSSCES